MCKLTQSITQTHVSAITDYRTISIVGPARTLLEVEKYALYQRLTVQMIPLRGKMHNPENAHLAEAFSKFCDTEEELKIPDARSFLVKFRSNITTQVMTEGSLVLEVARTILADKCRWYEQLIEVSKDLTQSTQVEHSLAAFGIGDCVSLEPFRKAGLKISKLDMFSLLSSSAPRIPMDFSPDAIAVVGLAARFPGANNVEELWDIINSGTSTVQEVPQERVNFGESFRVNSDERWAKKNKFYGNFISDHDCFDNSFFRVSGKEAIYMDPQQCLLLETAYQAMESSGYLSTDQKKEDGDRVGVFIGASFVDHLEHTSASTPNAYTATGTIRAFLSGKISHHFGWTGPSEVIDTACSSSLVAISRGCRALQRKECTSALVGGVNFLSTPTHYLDLGRASFLSPTGQCKPFDISADGYCRSEGVGLIVIKLLSEALANNDHIFGVIPGVSTNQGSDSKSITVPSSNSQLQLYKDILKESSLDPSSVTYVEAHGTGTQVGDPIEMEGIRKGFCSSNREFPINIGSIKANIGHSECAAGVAGVIKAILMVNKGIIPPLANFTRLNPKIPVLEPSNISIATSSKAWDVPHRAVIVNSYGAAGSNAALLMCESPQRLKSAPHAQASLSYPFMISAKSNKSLAAYGTLLKKHLQSPAGRGKTLGDVASTLSKGRESQEFAWTTTASSLEDLTKSLNNLQDVTRIPRSPKKVVLAFSGQSKQFVGLNKELYDKCPLLQKHLKLCDHYIMSTGSASIFPSVFQTEPLVNVVLLQCAMFAMQYSFARAWMDCGLEVDAVIGHSFGELTAMAVSGVLSLEGALDIIRARATLIQTKWGSDPGAMLVIHSTEAIVNDILSHMPEHSGRVEIACYNSKTSHVVVGSTSAILSLEQVIKDSPIFGSVRLSKVDTTHGFHSYLTDDLLPDLEDISKKQKFSAPKIPLERCTLEGPGSVSYEQIPQHMRRPVFFYQSVSRIERRIGPCIWLEAGTNSPIIPMIQRALDSTQDHSFLPLTIKNTQEPIFVLSEVTNRLWREGIRVSFFNFETPGLNKVWLPPYAFERTQNWLPYTDPTTEALRNIPGSLETPKPKILVESTPIRLVNPCGSSTEQKNKFTIGTSTVRFTSIVTGHSVIGNPLCPAALYLESAIMAAQFSLKNFEKYGYSFWNFRIDSPLGIDDKRSVFLDLDCEPGTQKWAFVLKSTLAGQAKTTVHAKANFKFFTTQEEHEASQMQYHQRVARARLAGFATNANSETFKMNRAYRLFSRVVNYSSVLTGMSSITMSGNEVMAELDLPPAPETEESSAISACDAIAMDNFVQVVGLLINSSDLCADNEAYLATGADNIIVIPGCDLAKTRKFTVYASFAPEGNSKASGDVFVLNREGILISVIIGMHFSKLPLNTLRKILEPANHKAMPASKASPTPVISPTRKEKEAPIIIQQPKHNATENAVSVTSLKKFVAEFSGLGESAIASDVLISDLGVDSLAAIELVGELEARFNIDISNNDITSMTIESLLPLISHTIKQRQNDVANENSSFSRSSSSSTLSSAGPSEGISSRSSVTNAGIQDDLIVLIAEYASIDKSSIEERSDLESLGIDSLSLIELKSALEVSYGVEVDFDTSITITELDSLLGLNQVTSGAIPPLLKSSVPLPMEPQSGIKVSKENIFAIIADYASVEPSLLTTLDSLESLGIDSLSLIELKSTLEELYSIELDFDVNTKVIELLSMLENNTENEVAGQSVKQTQPPRSSTRPSCTNQYLPVAQNQPPPQDPIEVLDECKANFDKFSQRHGLTGYWKTAKPKQDQLVVAYIVEAFRELGSNLHSITYGKNVPTINHLAKHSSLVSRLWEILVEAEVVEKRGLSYVRSSGALPSQTSDVMLQDLLNSYPQYEVDCKLLSITGSKLANCITGRADAVKLLFGDAANRDLLSSFYRLSPLFQPATEILLNLIDQIVTSSCGTFRILEVGAGTGATTALVAEFLHSRGCMVEYTFTDISSTLVTAAKKNFAKYPWMNFQTLDLEKDIPADLLNKYDLVLGTNVVHATADITKSCTKIRSILRENGLVVLLELTQNINWFDLVFGLLTGWWGATDGRVHALQTATAWSNSLNNAGFTSFGCSAGPSIESSIQQVLIGSTRPSDNSRYSYSKRYNIKTVPYKVVDDLHIEADVYFPSQPDASKQMPIG
jgi:acyl transferase domain-containing protein/acyl carrier protein/SAM-dependent methyltransferase